MKKQTRYLLILSIVSSILAITIIWIFNKPEYHGTVGSGGGYGLLFVSLYYFQKIWKAHKHADLEQTLEIKLSDERNNKIALHAGHLAFMSFLTLITLASFIALYLHYNLLSTLLMMIDGIALCIYGICFVIYRYIYK